MTCFQKCAGWMDRSLEACLDLCHDNERFSELTGWTLVAAIVLTVALLSIKHRKDGL